MTMLLARVCRRISMFSEPRRVKKLMPPPVLDERLSAALPSAITINAEGSKVRLSVGDVVWSSFDLASFDEESSRDVPPPNLGRHAEAALGRGWSGTVTRLMQQPSSRI